MRRWIRTLVAVAACQAVAIAADGDLPAWHLLVAATGSHITPARTLLHTWTATCHTRSVHWLSDTAGSPETAATTHALLAAIHELRTTVGRRDRVACYVGSELFDDGAELYAAGSGFQRDTPAGRRATGIALGAVRHELDALQCELALLILDAGPATQPWTPKALEQVQGHETSGRQARRLWRLASPAAATPGLLAHTLSRRLAAALARPDGLQLAELRDALAAVDPTGAFDPVPPIELLAPRRSVGVPRFDGDDGAGCADALQTLCLGAPENAGKQRVAWVERAGLDRIMGEKRLAASGLLEPGVAQEIGGLAHATHLVVGQVNPSQHQITVRLVDVAGGVGVATAAILVDYGELRPIQAMPKVAAALLERLTHWPSPPEWQQLPQIRYRPPPPALWPGYLKSYQPPSALDWTAYRVAGPDMDGMPQVRVPAGEVVLGSTDGTDGARPGVRARMSAFWMDLHCVTNAQYCRFLNALRPPEERRREWVALLGEVAGDVLPPRIGFEDGRYLVVDAGVEQHPVLYVSWEGAQAYARWVGRELPSEAQWERAARAGHVGWNYVWGPGRPDAAKPPANVADARCHIRFSQLEVFTAYDDGYATTSPVGAFPPNDFGLLDMAGNAWQWCRDTWSPGFVGSLTANARDPVCLEAGPAATCRGGAWDSSPEECGVGMREHALRGVRAYMLSFRCVESAPDVP